MYKVVILGGGTFNHVRNHLSLAVPAFGTTARHLNWLCGQRIDYLKSINDPCPIDQVDLRLTKMADPYSKIVTNDDVEKVVDSLIADPMVKMIFFNVAMTDFTGKIGDVESGKYADRLSSRDGPYNMELQIADKIVGKIRQKRKDIFLVAFKTTSGKTEDEQYIAGLNLLKANSVNLVLANDTVTRNNMVICPEEARYYVGTERNYVLEQLVTMAFARSDLTYTRSTVIDGPMVDWSSDVVPSALRTVVDHCIQQGAYKTFRGVTAGHFAVKIGDDVFLTSKRKSNFNDLKNVGLVHVQAFDDDKVVAIGAKPSVGGQSQRIIFREHPDLDCIVHFHCPLTEVGQKVIPVRPQWMFECGSHQCGKNTSDGLKQVLPGIWAVYLENHGPNIVFNRDINPKLVMDVIDCCFDLSAKTGGAVSLDDIRSIG